MLLLPGFLDPPSRVPGWACHSTTGQGQAPNQKVSRLKSPDPPRTLPGIDDGEAAAVLANAGTSTPFHLILRSDHAK
jgi:hypothetical protein